MTNRSSENPSHTFLDTTRKIKKEHQYSAWWKTSTVSIRLNGYMPNIMRVFKVDKVMAYQPKDSLSIQFRRFSVNRKRAVKSFIKPLAHVNFEYPVLMIKTRNMPNSKQSKVVITFLKRHPALI